MQINKQALLEATLNNAVQLAKMTAWHNGTRRENVKAMGDTKLKFNYDICVQEGFIHEADELLKEAKSRGLPWANTTNTNPQRTNTQTSAKIWCDCLDDNNKVVAREEEADDAVKFAEEHPQQVASCKMFNEATNTYTYRLWSRPVLTFDIISIKISLADLVALINKTNGDINALLGYIYTDPTGPNYQQHAVLVSRYNIMCAAALFILKGKNNTAGALLDAKVASLAIPSKEAAKFYLSQIIADKVLLQNLAQLAAQIK